MPLDKVNEHENRIRKILIVDAHPVVRLGLTHLINNSSNLVVCGEAENTHEAYEIIRVLNPDMAIVEISFRGLSGIELIERIKQQYPNFPILVFSTLDESFYAERVIQAGAQGYIMKHEPLKKVLETIYKILRKEIYVSEKIAVRIMHRSIYNRSLGESSPLELLSNRELEVFRLLGQGFGTRRIAKKLFLSVKTIEAYRAHIKDKLKLKNGDDLLQQAIHWVQSESKIG